MRRNELNCKLIHNKDTSIDKHLDDAGREFEYVKIYFMPQPGSHLVRLTSLRFFAALVVVLNHVTRNLAPIPVVSELAVMGTAGVGFFFALSGFILTWSHSPADRPMRFYRKRFARVYPLHLVTFVVAIPILIYTERQLTLEASAANLVLIQSWVPDSSVYFGVNAPSWSLACEAFFYLLFPLLIPAIRNLNRRKASQLVFVLVGVNFIIAITVTAILASGEPVRFFLYVFPPFRLLGFMAGAVLARWLQKGKRFRVSLALVVILAAAAYCVIFTAQHTLKQLFGHGVEDALLLPFILLIIAVAATSDIDQRAGILKSGLLRRLGEWSFALYLTHWLFLALVVRWFPDVSNATLPMRIFADALFIVLAIALSAAFYYLVERPAERALRGAPPRKEEAPRQSEAQAAPS